mmetsp:Transcript_19596/g.50957  ORF Transcript_19596/g.50957 Transcript_19596/m.50957 type:complete len:225 (-) Transcript_19596:1938-2612(-)
MRPWVWGTVALAVATSVVADSDDDRGSEETYRERVAKVPVLTDWNFDSTAVGDTPFVIYFHTSWCASCVNIVNSEFEKVYEEYMSDAVQGNTPQNVKFAHVDCTESPNLCHRLGQRAYPAVVTFYPKSGEFVPFLGNRDSQEIASFVDLAPKEPRMKLAPRPSTPMILLEYVEALMTTIELHEDELMNSTILGLLLGVCLLLPALVLYMLAYSALLAKDKLKRD